jgi:hypothetical protein
MHTHTHTTHTTHTHTHTYQSKEESSATRHKLAMAKEKDSAFRQKSFERGAMDKIGQPPQPQPQQPQGDGSKKKPLAGGEEMGAVLALDRRHQSLMAKQKQIRQREEELAEARAAARQDRKVILQKMNVVIGANDGNCRVVSCRVVSCRVVSCRVVSCRVVSCRIASCGVVAWPGAVVACLVLSCFCRVVSCRVVSWPGPGPVVACLVLSLSCFCLVFVLSGLRFPRMAPPLPSPSVR